MSSRSRMKMIVPYGMPSFNLSCIAFHEPTNTTQAVHQAITVYERDECVSNPCHDQGTCQDGVNSFTCRCSEGYTGEWCQTAIGPCDSGPCRNNGLCSRVVDGYICFCPLGYVGLHCEINMNDCVYHLCQNGGVCIDESNYYTCACFPGYTGRYCEKDTDECASNPCEHESTCKDHRNGYSCVCAQGYNGAHCENDIDECLSNLCGNGATCHDRINGYSCTCAPGYTGTFCHAEVDECASEPCRNGGACSDAMNGYNCTCELGYFGHLCESDNECVSSPCQNDAVCADKFNGYECLCPLGIQGDNCELDMRVVMKFEPWPVITEETETKVKVVCCAPLTWGVVLESLTIQRIEHEAWSEYNRTAAENSTNPRERRKTTGKTSSSMLQKPTIPVKRSVSLDTNRENSVNGSKTPVRSISPLNKHPFKNLSILARANIPLSKRLSVRRKGQTPLAKTLSSMTKPGRNVAKNMSFLTKPHRTVSKTRTPLARMRRTDNGTELRRFMDIPGTTVSSQGQCAVFTMWSASCKDEGVYVCAAEYTSRMTGKQMREEEGNATLVIKYVFPQVHVKVLEPRSREFIAGSALKLFCNGTFRLGQMERKWHWNIRYEGSSSWTAYKPANNAVAEAPVFLDSCRQRLASTLTHVIRYPADNGANFRCYVTEDGVAVPHSLGEFTLPKDQTTQGSTVVQIPAAMPASTDNSFKWTPVKIGFGIVAISALTSIIAMALYMVYRRLNSDHDNIPP